MNEREQLQNARNELATSIQLLNRNLKIFASANVNYANSKIMTVKNNILDSFKNIKVQFNEYKEKQNDRRIEKENEKNRMMAEKFEEKARHERTKEHTNAMKEILREQDRQKRERAFLKFKYGVTQKVKSNFSKLGVVKNNALYNLNQLKNTFDLKISNAFDKAKLSGLQIETRILNFANGVKNYSSEQIAKISAWRYEQQQARKEKEVVQEAERNRIMAEQLEEEARYERTKEHANAIEEILKEQENSLSKSSLEQNKDVNDLQNVMKDNTQIKPEKFDSTNSKSNDSSKEAIDTPKINLDKNNVQNNLETKLIIEKTETKTENKQGRKPLEQSFLQFKYGVTQKVKGSFSKLGTVKNNALQDMSRLKNTFDLKVSNAFDKAKLSGLQIETRVLNFASGVKNYSSEQIAKFSAWRYEQQQALNERKAVHEMERNRRMLEQQKEMERHERTKEHVSAMKEILKNQDRQEELEKQSNLKQEIQRQIELMKKAKNEFFGDQKGQDVESKGRSL